MNELNELIDKIKEGTVKNNELKAKKKEFIESLRETIKRNYSLIQDELFLYCNLAVELKDNFHSGCASYYEGGIDLFYQYGYSSKQYFKLTTKQQEFWVLFNESSSQLTKRLNEDWIAILSEYFDTEEHTMQFLDRVRKGYAVIFEAFLQSIDEENSELAEVVGKLQEVLAKSSVMEKKEDGSVTIHIGGKTFTGKLVEEDKE